MEGNKGMIEYLIKYHDKLERALYQHIGLVFYTLLFSVAAACVLTVVLLKYPRLEKAAVHFFEMLYCIPSLALFAVMIPVTGLGRNTAVIVMTGYNQFILLRNFLDGLKNVDPAVIEAARGMGMSERQILLQVRLPLAKKAVFAGIHLAIVATIGIATIAATINAGGIGSLLFDGLRTLNPVKIVWGALLSAGLAIAANALLNLAEKRLA